MLKDSGYNPDILSCIANLSSDEVFTPPALVNQMLDLLPEKLWEDPNTKVLDPASKSGVFLREIAKRLDKGLENKIPDRQKRFNHIFQKQLFGLAITELTALLARRSLYCSKTANGKYSVGQGFKDGDGNVHYERIEHSWKDGRCAFCGANESNYGGGEESESHAYSFIHNQIPEEIAKMKFDVIIGNPPYQLNDGGGTGSSSKPIYQHFVEQAKKLNPRYLTMIIPSRWFSGGKGLDTFRRDMLSDTRISHIVDYTDSTAVFPGVDIAGGVCYFLWERDYNGMCTIENIHNNIKDVSKRALNEFSTLIRDSISIKIIHKIRENENEFFDSLVSSRKPFGLDSKARPSKNGDLTLVWSGGEGPFDSQNITDGISIIDKWKVMISKTSYDHGGQPDKEGKRRILSRVEILPPKYVCTESYLIAGSYNDKIHADNMITYLKTKFARFLVSTILFTQNITKDRFSFVPIQDFNETWTDEKLYKKYDLSQDEIDFIESMIRPMELDNDQ